MARSIGRVMKRAGIVCVFTIAMSTCCLYVSQSTKPRWPPAEPSTEIGSAITSIAEIDRLETSAPRLEISWEPSSREVQAYRKVRCTVQLHARDGDLVPNALFLALRHQRSEFGRVPLQIVNRERGEFVLQATLRAPSRPGTYRLVILAEHILRGEALGGKDQDLKSRTPRSLYREVGEAGLVVTR